MMAILYRADVFLWSSLKAWDFHVSLAIPVLEQVSSVIRTSWMATTS